MFVAVNKLYVYACWVAAAAGAPVLGSGRIKLYHVQELTGANGSAMENYKEQVTAMAKDIFATYPGSAVGMWSFGHQNAESCGRRNSVLTQDVAVLNDSLQSLLEVDSSKTLRCTDPAGRNVEQLLWYVPVAPESHWETGDTDPACGSTPSARVISLYAARPPDCFSGDLKSCHLASGRRVNYPPEAVLTALQANELHVVVAVPNPLMRQCWEKHLGTTLGIDRSRFRVRLATEQTFARVITGAVDEIASRTFGAIPVQGPGTGAGKSKALHGSSDVPCRVKYMYVTDASAPFNGGRDLMQPWLTEAFDHLLESAPGSSVGIWYAQSKENFTAAQCGKQLAAMTDNADAIHVALAQIPELTSPDDYSGRSLEEMLWWLPQSTSVGWEFNDDQTQYAAIKALKIVGLGASDATFRYLDPLSTQSSFLPEYDYAEEYSPENDCYCRSTSYPELVVTSESVVSNHVNVQVLTYGKVAPPFPTGTSVKDWYENHLSVELGLKDYAVTEIATGIPNPVQAYIEQVWAAAGCTPTTTTSPTTGFVTEQLGTSEGATSEDTTFGDPTSASEGDANREMWPYALSMCGVGVALLGCGTTLYWARQYPARNGEQNDACGFVPNEDTPESERQREDHGRRLTHHSWAS